MNTQRESIGLIGVGLVGTAMATRLLASGTSLIGYDVAPVQLDRLVQRGGRTADSPRAVAEAVDRLLLSLPNSDVVRDVIEGSGGVLEASRIPPYIIDTTTGDPEQAVVMAATLARRGCAFLEATVSGSSRQLGAGEAVLMVGGERDAFENCKPLLRMLAERIFYVGPSGNASKCKLATNLVVGLNRLVCAEGLVFAEKLGLDPRTFLDLLKAGPAYSAAMDVKGEKLLHRDFTPESRIRQHYKDVTLILKYAQDCGQELPLSRVHFEILQKAIAAGDGGLDTCAVIREIRRRTAGGTPERRKG